MKNRLLGTTWPTCRSPMDFAVLCPVRIDLETKINSSCWSVFISSPTVCCAMFVDKVSMKNKTVWRYRDESIHKTNLVWCYRILAFHLLIAFCSSYDQRRLVSIFLQVFCFSVVLKNIYVNIKHLCFMYSLDWSFCASPVLYEEFWRLYLLSKGQLFFLYLMPQLAISLILYQILPYVFIAAFSIFWNNLSAPIYLPAFILLYCSETTLLCNKSTLLLKYFNTSRHEMIKKKNVSPPYTSFIAVLSSKTYPDSAAFVRCVTFNGPGKYSSFHNCRLCLGW